MRSCRTQILFDLVYRLVGIRKSTLANMAEISLHKQGFSTYILDGDNIRQGINKDLSFAPKDRTENIRRIAEISNLMLDAGVMTLAAFVSPYIRDREKVNRLWVQKILLKYMLIPHLKNVNVGM